MTRPPQRVPAFWEFSWARVGNSRINTFNPFTPFKLFNAPDLVVRGPFKTFIGIKKLREL